MNGGVTRDPGSSIISSALVAKLPATHGRSGLTPPAAGHVPRTAPAAATAAGGRGGPPLPPGVWPDPQEPHRRISDRRQGLTQGQAGHRSLWGRQDGY